MSAVVIMSNILAMNAHRNMKAVGTKNATASRRLSSGKKINSAADDAAGVAISEKMKAQIRGLERAQQNTLEGSKLIQTMDGGMQEVNNILQRCRELTLQAMNDTCTEEDRALIKQEIDQCVAEIGDITDVVEYNTIDLLNVPGANQPPYDMPFSPKLLTSDNVPGAVYYPNAFEQDLAPGDILGGPVAGASPACAIYPEVIDGNTIPHRLDDFANNYEIGMKTGDTLDYTLNFEVDIKPIVFYTPDYPILDSSGNPLANRPADADSVDGDVIWERNPAPPKYIYPDITIASPPIGAPGSEKIYVWKLTGTTDGTKAVNNVGIGWVNPSPSPPVFPITTINPLPPPPSAIDRSAFNPNTNISSSFNLNSGPGTVNFSVTMRFEKTSGDCELLNPTAADPNFPLSGNTLNPTDNFSGTWTKDVRANPGLTYTKDATYTKKIYKAANPFQGWNDDRDAAGNLIPVQQSTFTDPGNPGQKIKADYRKSHVHHVSAERSVTKDMQGEPPLWIQTGANQDQGTWIDRYDCRPSALGLTADWQTFQDSLLFTDPYEKAAESLGRIDTAIDKVATYRAQDGAQHNRLEHAASAAGTMFENLSDANSRIEDADMAKEMMNFTKTNVLQQAAVAMLVQARTQPENTLMLLR